MTTRVITLPDGQRLEIQDVPDFVQDSELVSYYAPQYMQPEEEDEPFERGAPLSLQVCRPPKS